MGALHSLVSIFSPSLSQLLLVESLAWSDEFMEFVFVKLKGLKIIYLSDCANVMAVQFLSLLNRMNDWEHYCILPLLAQIIIEPPHMDNKEYKAQMEDKIASHIVPLFHLRDPHKTRQFSLHIVHHNTTVSKEMHEAYTSLKKDGYAFEIWYRKWSAQGSHIRLIGDDYQ